jgi:hypothetical protein
VIAGRRDRAYYAHADRWLRRDVEAHHLRESDPARADVLAAEADEARRALLAAHAGDAVVP